MWEFDDQVANRFRNEALQHIPDYERVINTCLDIAHKKGYAKECNVIDVGSATGTTVDRFVSAGYTNVYGVEASEAMIARSLHKDRIIHSSIFPNIESYFVMANWTLHFVNQREEYVRSVYNRLAKGGSFVLTEKTTQSELIKSLYYEWKISNGVDPLYILQKEQDLKGVMVTYPAEWYIEMLRHVGFTEVEVINSRFGFVTFYCEK